MLYEEESKARWPEKISTRWPARCHVTYHVHLAEPKETTQVPLSTYSNVNLGRSIISDLKSIYASPGISTVRISLFVIAMYSTLCPQFACSEQSAGNSSSTAKHS